MKNAMKYMSKMLMFTVFLFLGACGGGGGGSAPADGSAVITQNQALASLALSGGVDTIGSVSVDIDLPEGFSLETDACGNLVDGVLNTNQPGAYVVATYQPETALAVGHVQFAFIDGDGFSPSEFATLVHVMTTGEVLPLPANLWSQI